MSDINMTYDLLFDILRNEKGREDLQKLENNFYVNVVEYLNSKENIINNPNTPHGERELTRIQLGNVKRLLVELYDRREKKIINLSIYKIKTSSGLINTEGLLEEEKILFENIHADLSRQRENLLYKVIEGKMPIKDILVSSNKNYSAGNVSSDNLDKNCDEYSNEEGIKSIRFIKPVPKFLGPELETYGPFEENDIASLPSKIANILISKNRAEEMHMN